MASDVCSFFGSQWNFSLFFVSLCKKNSILFLDAPFKKMTGVVNSPRDTHSLRLLRGIRVVDSLEGITVVSPIALEGCKVVCLYIIHNLFNVC